MRGVGGGRGREGENRGNVTQQEINSFVVDYVAKTSCNQFLLID